MNKNKLKNTAIPKQRRGAKSDISKSVVFKTPKEAQAFFNIAKDRLLNVSIWHELCGLVTAKFELADHTGNKVRRLVMQGDYLRIDIPGPGSQTGSGYDWVKIESIVNKSNAAEDYEEVIMRARPSTNPMDNVEETAHFFQDAASSTFMVVRKKNMVKAEIHGRNELPNIKQENIIDSIRNTFIALAAMLGFSKSQWKKLVNGIVSTKRKENPA